VTTARQHEYLAAIAAQNEARLAATLRKRKRFRQVGLLSLLCFSVLQYYFLSIGVEILSMPNLIVFFPTPGAG
jgi:hypothetical protein